MSNIEIQKLAAVPFLDIPNLQGRTISSLIFYDEGNWRMWIEAGDSLVEIKAWPAEAFYFAKQEADPDDIGFHFLDFMSQRACFPEVVLPLTGIHDDIFNLSASIAKIEHLHSTRAMLGTGASRMVAAEVEYIFLACRSIFDLLQEIASKLWQTITLIDPRVEKKALKASFNEMTHFQGRPVTQDSLIQRFGLPVALADYYVEWQEFFDLLRIFRDNIVHHGSRVPTIYNYDNGFFVSKTLRPFHDLDIWRSDEYKGTEQVPLLPALGYFICKTLGACEAFSLTLSEIIDFPPPIAPGMRLFLRGYFNQSFARTIRDALERDAEKT